jgi:anti-sigma factor RsiW
VTSNSRLEQLSAFIDGELTPTEMAELTEHLRTCPACVQHLAELTSLRVALAEAIPEGEVTDEFLARINRRLDDLTEESQTVSKRERVVRFVRRYHAPKLRVISYSAMAAALAATVVFALMKQPENTVDLAAVRDATLRTSLVSDDVPDNIAAKVAGFHVAAARYDIVAGHRALVVTYQDAADVVTLCSWAANAEPAHGVKEALYREVRISYWNDGTTEFWAAGRTSSTGIASFVKAFRESSISS